MLTKTNYHEWSLLMKVKMQARQLWDAIEYGDLPYHDDRRVLAAIIVGVPPEMGAPLADKASAKEAWYSNRCGTHRRRPRSPRHVAAAAQGLGEPRLLHL